MQWQRSLKSPMKVIANTKCCTIHSKPVKKVQVKVQVLSNINNYVCNINGVHIIFYTDIYFKQTVGDLGKLTMPEGNLGMWQSGKCLYYLKAYRSNTTIPNRCSFDMILYVCSRGLQFNDFFWGVVVGSNCAKNKLISSFNIFYIKLYWFYEKRLWSTSTWKIKHFM